MHVNWYSVIVMEMKVNGRKAEFLKLSLTALWQTSLRFYFFSQQNDCDIEVISK